MKVCHEADHAARVRKGTNLGDRASRDLELPPTWVRTPGLDPLLAG